ncbi:hypothetical protein B0A55_10535 [Friedmanniomyces simplex]|uniref:Uncharacterized protein n=1 Tax=Friedmanniomyces simplex TaxID=329884 RepID=A0A4U0WJM9_9PEZI|nr:hypothetical protein B0A55_10535 [Friedmanniomyces simplex]
MPMPIAEFWVFLYAIGAAFGLTHSQTGQHRRGYRRNKLRKHFGKDTKHYVEPPAV